MVNLEPLIGAPIAVQLHVLTVVPAFVLGTWLLFGSGKGSRAHRRAGKIYLALMAVTSLAAVCIQSFSATSLAVGPLRLGLLHVFVPLTAYGIYGALVTIRAGNIAGHKRAMFGVYFGGLIVAGLLAFSPGRIMHRVFFG